MSTDVRIALVTAPSPEVAGTLARTVVGEGLAACANLVPGVTSIYRWDGEVHEDAEVLLVLKTTDAVLPALTDRVVALHPYDVPEVIATGVLDGHPDYLSWVRGAVSIASGEG